MDYGTGIWSAPALTIGISKKIYLNSIRYRKTSAIIGGGEYERDFVLRVSRHLTGVYELFNVDALGENVPVPFDVQTPVVLPTVTDPLRGIEELLHTTWSLPADTSGME